MLDELPEGTRAGLSPEGKSKLRERFQSKSVVDFSEKKGFEADRVYSWLNREMAVPLSFLRELDFETEHINCLKGRGRSLEIREPELPLNPSDEFLTRVSESVVRDENGVPVYITKDRGNLERFKDLLRELGDVQTTIYDRDGRYQLRYPKFLHLFLSDRDFEEVFAARVDESGEVSRGFLRVGDERRPIADFEGRLYSTSERYRLAASKGRMVTESLGN